MSQGSVLIDTLKRVLRQRGVTYAMVAKRIGLSEASVKRLFSQRDMGLQRLEQICESAHIELVHLLDMTRETEHRIQEMTLQQETALIREPKLLLIALLVMNHWRVEEILETYRLGEAEVVRLLTRLDRLKLIDLMPGNRIKMKLARNFSWRKSGPIQQFFEARVQKQFFQSSFLRPNELRIMVHGMLSDSSNRHLQQRMRKLAEEFDAYAENDRKLGLDMRHGTTFVMAVRPWELDIFTELRRDLITPADGLNALQRSR